MRLRGLLELERFLITMGSFVFFQMHSISLKASWPFSKIILIIVQETKVGPIPLVIILLTRVTNSRSQFSISKGQVYPGSLKVCIDLVVPTKNENSSLLLKKHSLYYIFLESLRATNMSTSVGLLTWRSRQNAVIRILLYKEGRLILFLFLVTFPEL